jgi:hypothetical protein
MSLLTLLTWSAVGYDVYNRHHSSPHAHFTRWGGGGGIVTTGFTVASLLPDANKYRVMVACRIEDHSVDVMQDKRLEKSEVFDIRRDSMLVDVKVSEDFKARIKLGGLVDVYLIELPKDVKPDNITSPASIEMLGGKLVDFEAFGLAPGHFSN